jgi:CRP-like cAMP-binding protein
VRILHLEPDEGAGELTRLLARARSVVAEDLARRFKAAGAGDVRVEAGPRDELGFGARLRTVAGSLEVGAGLVVLGSGSIALASDDDLARLVETASSGERAALTNNRYSSDVVAIGDAAILASAPDLPADNTLPRWLETLGVPVEELAHRDRLALDLDSPLDLELLRRHPACPPALSELAGSMAHRLARASEAFDELAAIARNPRMELLVAGRISASTLRSLELDTACRIRAFVEERGLRTSAPLQRPPASILGLVLDRDGPTEIGVVVARLADGALIDSRVLLAHRLGGEESSWPSPEDRYASDLLLADRVRDPWLQQLTLHAWSHKVPIALGAHSLVGPGLRHALALDPAPHS